MKLDVRDGLSWLFLILFMFIISAPKATYFTILEQYVWARVFLLLGLAFSMFFQGMKQKDSPLMLDLILTIVSLTWVSLVWGQLQSYVYMESTNQTTIQDIFGLIILIIGNVSFYGFGALFQKALKEINP